jgi:ATP-dependent DNA ligase
MQFKYDGIWCCVSDQPDHDWHCDITSRNGNVKGQFVDSRFPAHTSIVGEYMFGTQWAQDRSRAGKVYCYDLLMLRGVDLRNQPYSERYAQLKELLSWLEKDRPGHDRLVFANTFSSINIRRILQQLQITRAYEGFVVRNWDQPYSADIGRYKLDIEDDFVVTGFYQGEGKHAGRLGGIIVGQYNDGHLVEIMRVGGGFSDFQRELIWAHMDKYRGAVVRITGKARFASGAFRHPNFACFREDKQASECITTKPSISPTEQE